MQERPRIRIVFHQVLHALETIIHEDGKDIKPALQALLEYLQVFVFLNAIITERITENQVYLFPVEV